MDTLWKVIVEGYKDRWKFAILGLYIVGADTYRLVWAFSKVQSTFLAGKQKISKNVYFFIKKWSFLSVFLP